jgi:hypothetical protein
VSPVKYELGFYILEDDILHSHSSGNVKSQMRRMIYNSYKSVQRGREDNHTEQWPPRGLQRKQLSGADRPAYVHIYRLSAAKRELPPRTSIATCQPCEESCRHIPPSQHVSPANKQLRPSSVTTVTNSSFTSAEQ